MCWCSPASRCEPRWDVLGPIRAELHVRASSGHAHVFVRLCDVDTEGRSRNVTDGIVRLGPGATGRQAVSVLQLKRARWPETQRVRHLPSLITRIPAGTPPGAI